MNDFTKEELKTLDYLIDSYCQHSIPPEGIYALLKDKIETMLDNYCEHEFEIKSLSPHFLMMCDKCDKTFIDGSFPG